METTQVADPKRKSIHYHCKLNVLPTLFPRTAGFFSYLITTLRLLASELHDRTSYGVDPMALNPAEPRLRRKPPSLFELRRVRKAVLTRNERVAAQACDFCGLVGIGAPVMLSPFVFSPLMFSPFAATQTFALTIPFR